jgi:pimeloyl-ACP methyl ester carboxylesterase
LPDSTSGPGLIDAARSAGVQVREPALPEDRFYEASGIRFHCLDWGNADRPPLLLLHGFAQQAHSWDFVALGLRDLCHIVSADLRGHGDSGWPAAPDYRIGDYARDVAALVDAAALRAPIVCGLSLGGRVAFTHAASAPAATRALIVVDAGPSIAPAGRDRIRRFVESQQVFDSFDELVAHTMRYTRRLRTEAQVRGSLRHATRRTPDGKWTWKYDPRLRERRPADPEASEQRMWAVLGSIRCPSLFIRGSESDIVTPEALDQMRRAVPGSEAATVERAGHLVPGDNPAGFVQAVRPFLERVTAGAG